MIWSDLKYLGFKKNSKHSCMDNETIKVRQTISLEIRTDLMFILMTQKSHRNHQVPKKCYGDASILIGKEHNYLVMDL